jgi:hypothetical protein
MVVKATIKQALIDMMNEMKTLTDVDEAIDKNATLLSEIIYDAILSADVIDVTAQGTYTVVGTSPSGAVTGTATGVSTQNNLGKLQ